MRGRRGGAPTGRRCRPARPRPRNRRRRTGLNLPQLGGELGQQRSPYLGPARVPGGRRGRLRTREQPPASGLVTAAGRGDLAAEAAHRRRVDRGEAQRQGPGDVAQLAPGQRRGEQDVDVAAAGRRDVGDVAAAEPLEQLAELGRLALNPVAVCTQVSAAAARVEVKGQHPAGGRARVVDRHRARLARRLSGQRPGMPGRVSAAAVVGDPDVRRTG